MAWDPLSSDLSRWESDRVAVLKTALCESFLRWSLMGGRPARASTPLAGDVQNAPMIQHTALRCIEVRDLRVPAILAPLKNHSLWPYVAIGRTHALYRTRLLWGDNPRVELPNILMAVTVVRALVA